MFETVCLPKSSAAESHFKSLSVKVSTLEKEHFTRLAQAFQLILTPISWHFCHFRHARNLKAILSHQTKKNPLQGEWKILRIQDHKP